MLQMAPRDGALIAGITKFVENEEEIAAAVKEMHDELDIDQVCKLR